MFTLNFKPQLSLQDFTGEKYGEKKASAFYITKWTDKTREKAQENLQTKHQMAAKNAQFTKSFFSFSFFRLFSHSWNVFWNFLFNCTRLLSTITCKAWRKLRLFPFFLFQASSEVLVIMLMIHKTLSCLPAYQVYSSANSVGKTSNFSPNWASIRR